MTVSNVAELAADLRDLATHASRRYGDGYTLDGARVFLTQVLSVPEYAWGNFPWSREWARKWQEGANPRLAEVRVVRDKTQEMAARLVQLASDLADTDLELALDFSRLTDPYLRPYLDAIQPPGHTARYVPGTPSSSAPIPPDHAADTPPSASIPPSNDSRLRALKLISLRAGPKNSMQQYDDHLKGGPAPTTDPAQREWESVFGNNDSLTEFLKEHQGTLDKVERILSAVDPAAMRPMRDFLNDAQYCYPRMIDSHANLVNTAANVYQNLARDLAADRRLLLGKPVGHGYWEGRAAIAYGEYSQLHVDHLGQLATHAYWFAEAGRRAANTLKVLRNAYAQYGAEHTGRLIASLQDYYDVVDNFFDCSSAKEAAKGLLKAVKDYTDAMLGSLKSATDDAAATYRIEEKAITGFPMLDDLSHAQTPYPRPAGDPYSWADENGWK